MEPPETRAINDGVTLLRELGALPEPGTKGGTTAKPGLTAVGRKLAQLPVDPRLGRMIVEAGQRGCVREVMMLAAALTIQDPRERPDRQQQQATEKHKRFRGRELRLHRLPEPVELLQEKQQELSSTQFRKLCRTEFINYLRVREWQDLFAQLRQLARPLGISLDNNGTSTPSASTRASTSACWPACSATSASSTNASANTPAPAAPGSPSSRARRCSRSRPTVRDGRRTGGNEPAVGPGGR